MKWTACSTWASSPTSRASSSRRRRSGRRSSSPPRCPPEIETLTKWILRDPIAIEIGRRQSAAETVAHALYPVAKDQKMDLLLAMLETTEYPERHHLHPDESRRRHGRQRGSTKMNHNVAVMHSDRSQGERTEALAGFKSGQIRGARRDRHRRARPRHRRRHATSSITTCRSTPRTTSTASAAPAARYKTGDAFTIFTAEEIDAVRKIERYIGTKIPRDKAPGLQIRLHRALRRSLPEARRPRQRRPHAHRLQLRLAEVGASHLKPR